MAFPAGLTLVSVHGRFDNPPSGGAAGAVKFSARYPLQGPTDNSVVPPFDQTVTLDANGEFTVSLPATNDPDWTPVNWTYDVLAMVGARAVRGTLQLNYQTTSVELADLLQVDGAATPGITYATLAQLAATQAEVDALEVAVNLKAPLASPTFTGTVSGVSKAMVGLGNVDNLADPLPTPLDHGLLGWTFDPVHQQAGTVQTTAGLAQVVRIRALGSTITNIIFHLTAGGSSLTAGQCFAALYNDAGALLGGGAVTADQSTAWGTSGVKIMPLSVAQAVTPGGWYKVLWWFNGTTGPSLSRDTNAGSSMLNIGLGASTARYATANSGLTTAAPANIGTTSGGSTAWWVGLS